MHKPSTTSNAFTLVEMLLALTILAIVSTAVTALLAGAARTSQYVTTQSDSSSEAENAFRRIMHNVRTASAISAPATTTASNSLTLTTQPDAANGGAAYTVTYALVGTSLTESDARYNPAAGAPNVIATDITAFSVQRSGLTGSQTLTLSLTVGSNPGVTRTVVLYCRNL